MPLRVLLTPLAAATLLSALTSDPIPSLSSIFASEFYQSLALVLTIYLSSAFGYVFWSSYQETIDRTAATRHYAPNWLVDFFSLQTGLIISLLALIIWGNNITALYSLPKSTSIQVVKTSFKDQQVLVKLKVSDPEHNFRRFHPMLLNLASEKRSPLAGFPNQILVNGAVLDLNESLRSVVSNKLKPVELSLTYSVKQTKNKLLKLADLHLWYGADLVAPLNSRQLPPNPDRQELLKFQIAKTSAKILL